jgi:hypothetical protein
MERLGGFEIFVARFAFNTKDTKDTKVRIVGPSFVSFVSSVFARFWNQLATENGCKAWYGGGVAMECGLTAAPGAPIDP